MTDKISYKTLFQTLEGALTVFKTHTKNPDKRVLPTKLSKKSQ